MKKSIPLGPSLHFAHYFDKNDGKIYSVVMDSTLVVNYLELRKCVHWTLSMSNIIALFKCIFAQNEKVCVFSFQDNVMRSHFWRCLCLTTVATSIVVVHAVPIASSEKDDSKYWEDQARVRASLITKDTFKHAR